MKKCDDCKYADWERTKAGRLHPSKVGRCRYVWTPKPLPLAYPGGPMPLKIADWRIERGAVFEDHCPCWQKAEAGKVGG